MRFQHLLRCRIKYNTDTILQIYLEILSSLFEPFSEFSDHEVENEQCHSYLCCYYHVCVGANVAVQSHDVKFVIYKASCKSQRQVLPKLLLIPSLTFTITRNQVPPVSENSKLSMLMAYRLTFGL